MTEKEDQWVNRRGILLGVLSFFAGVFIDPFRRYINQVLLITPFGREAEVQCVFTKPIEISEQERENNYFDESATHWRTVQVLNTGRETAEGIRLTFYPYESAVGYTEIQAVSQPPSPPTKVAIQENGAVEVNIDYLPPKAMETQDIIVLRIETNTNERSGASHQIGNQDGGIIHYTYSWTFLGERYYNEVSDE